MLLKLHKGLNIAEYELNLKNRSTVVISLRNSILVMRLRVFAMSSCSSCGLGVDSPLELRGLLGALKVEARSADGKAASQRRQRPQRPQRLRRAQRQTSLITAGSTRKITPDQKEREIFCQYCLRRSPLRVVLPESNNIH